MKGFIHRLFTGYPQDIHHPQQLLGDVEALRARVMRLESRLATQEDAHQALVERVHKLTGQVHGPRGGRPRLVQTASDIPAGDKEALREYVGLKAGSKFTHQE
jgi:hypothetical protein